VELRSCFQFAVAAVIGAFQIEEDEIDASEEPAANATVIHMRNVTSTLATAISAHLTLSHAQGLPIRPICAITLSRTHVLRPRP
jgi:hypothetical protein